MGNRAKPDSWGFTLIELLVSMAVLAILLMAALPSFTDFFDRYRLRGAVDDVVSVISNARVESVKSDRDVNISFGSTAAGWCLGANAAVIPAAGVAAPGALACDCGDAAACVVGDRRLAVDAGKHRDVTVDDLLTTFNFDSKLGLVSPLSPHSIIFSSPSGTYSIAVTVNPLGQANVCIPSLPTQKPPIAGVPSC